MTASAAVATHACHLRQRVESLIVAWAVAIVLAYSYWSIVTYDEWERRDVTLSFDGSPAGTKMASTRRVMECSFRIVGFTGANAAAALVGGFLARQDRHAPKDALLCRGGPTVQFVESSPASRGAALTLGQKNPAGVAVQLRSTTSGDHHESVTITMVLDDRRLVDTHNASTGVRCASRRESSLQFSVVCSVAHGPSSPISLDRRGTEVWSLIKVDPDTPAARHAAVRRARTDVLRDVVRRHHTTAITNIPLLARELFVESFGPETADEIETVAHSIVPEIVRDALPTRALRRLGTALSQRLASSSADGTTLDADKLSEMEATAALSDPSWTSALMLPPDQLMALHMPLFLPILVALLGSARIVTTDGLRRKRRAAEGTPR